ncbi:MAG: OmpH family outer membrane protein [Bacteroidetes bacterium]|nr:OmpH family outer membrane protein [Bacteroidota bacterium]
MSKRSLVLLVIWNVLLSGAFIWMAVRPKASADAGPSSVLLGDTSVKAVVVPRDTAGLRSGRIAFFFMDSVQSRFELVKESADRVRNEGRRLEGDLQKEMQKAQARYAELMNKDHTYSTQAELSADKEELDKLGARIQQLRSDSQDRLDEMQMHMLQTITLEIQNYLEEYNRTARFDYIFSIQEGGQIWVGNKGLDITADVVGGLNQRHQARKAAPAKP